MNVGSLYKKHGGRREECILLIVGALLSGFLMTGCKPTEKNYRSAYNAALEKRERDEERRRELQSDLGVDREALHDVDEAGSMMITLTDPTGEEELRLLSKARNFHREDSVRGVVAAVATMKMESNARSLASDLNVAGFPKARAVRSGEDYVVIIDEGETPSALSLYVTKFRKLYPEFLYMGQGEMLLFYSR
ncbi:MAG: hypothetical protein K2J15_02010 [Muribaculaceae bacterium]|nr:hypothetical protein [Muribaculaceae bacterium]